MTSFLSQIRTKALVNAGSPFGGGDGKAVHDAIARGERERAQTEGRQFGRRMPESNPPALKRDVAAAVRVIAEPYFRHSELQPPPRDVVMRRPATTVLRPARRR